MAKCLAILSLLSLSITIQAESISKHGYKICESDACVNYAQMLINNLNQSVDPCGDFFEFSCGKYLSNKVILDDQPIAGIYQDAVKQNNILLTRLLSEEVTEKDDHWTKNAKNFYSSCMNQSAIDQFSEGFAKSFLESELGGWPMITNRENSIPIVDLMLRFLKYQQSNFALVDVFINPNNNQKKIIKLGQIDSYPIDIIDREDFKPAFKEFFQKSFEYLGSARSPQDLDQDIEDVFVLSKRLSQIMVPPSEIQNTQNSLELTLFELQQQIPKFPWVDLLVKAFKNFNIEITLDEPISISQFDYLKRMQDLYYEYSTEKPNVLKNFLFASFFSTKLSDFLPERYQVAKLNFTKIFTGQVEYPDRNIICVSAALLFLPNEIGKFFSSVYLGKEAKRDAEKITRHILGEFIKVVNESDWMDMISKDRAIDKALHIDFQIGYSNLYENQTFVEKSFNYVLDPNNFLKNGLTILNYNQRINILGSLREDVNPDIWYVSAAEINAYYLVEKNQISILAGILTPPFYQLDLPYCLKYGSIGFPIGYQITNGFGPNGIRYDRTGNIFMNGEEGLWTESTLQRFINKTECMKEQYSGFFIERVNASINGELTLNNNIADNGGVIPAYRAFINNIPKSKRQMLPGLDLTPEQLFFVAMAQPWCEKSRDEYLLTELVSSPFSPSDYRIRGISLNFQPLRDAFKCDDSKRNIRQCAVW